MEFHLVGIQEPAGILPDVEAGIEIRLFLEKRKVQDADTDALLEYIIFLPLFNLVGVHLSGIEEGAIRLWQREEKLLLITIMMYIWESLIITVYGKCLG